VTERPRDIGDQQTRFDRFAEAASRFVSEAAFFTISAILVAVWVPTIWLFHSVDTWQLVLNTVTSVLAFLLIALLQNSERRYDRALHVKVDALAAALAVVIRHQAAHDDADEDLNDVVVELEAAIGLEERSR
jgi:low affinity Fe/Cu permease